MGDSKVGLQARLMSQAMRKLTGIISRTNTCCIFINQLREKIGVMFGPSETTTGGNALKFYSSVRIDIRPSTTLKDKEDNVLGRHAKVKVVKNKVAPPFKRAEFDIMFGEGISRSSEIIDLGVELGIITKSGSWFSYDGSKLAQGRDSAKLVIEDNPELAQELEEKIAAALKGADDMGAKAKGGKKAAKAPAAPAGDDEPIDDDLIDDGELDIDDDFADDEEADLFSVAED